MCNSIYSVQLKTGKSHLLIDSLCHLLAFTIRKGVIYSFLIQKMTAKRYRKRDFSQEELNELVTQFVENNHELTQKHSNDVTNKRKQEILRDIATSVNAIGGQERSIEALKEKLLV